MFVRSAATDTFRDWRPAFARRSRILLMLLLAWSALLTWRMFDVMILQRGGYLARFEAHSWRIGTLPALRGRILDSDGRPLVWSERYFALVYRVPADRRVAAGHMERLALPLGTTGDALMATVDGRRAGDEIVLRESLEPQEIAKLEALLLEHESPFTLNNTYRRVRGFSDPSLAGPIGRTHVFGQKEVGMTGWEQEYDRNLRGTDGKYRVMVDPQGNWIESTWEQLRPPAAGLDVYVPIRYAELGFGG